jgi:hypothetical protein
VTFIYRDELKNIPPEIADGATHCLANALNHRNRDIKRQRFGFSTSEDAVAWVVFVYLLRSSQLISALKNCGVLPESTAASNPSLLLWGSSVGGSETGAAMRGQLKQVCTGIGEDPQSMSEPDVIVDAGPAGLVFIEVKYHSRNDEKPKDYAGWHRYFRRLGTFRDENAVRESGCYELTRNWYLLDAIADGRPATLVNLGFNQLFAGPRGERLAQFESALPLDGSHHFVRLIWPDLLRGLANSPRWFTEYCIQRKLLGAGEPAL